jgi:hypothetical protein
MAGQVVAVDAFATQVNGREVVVHDGDVFDATHAVVRGREHLFKPLDEHHNRPDIETAPSKKRGTRKR